MFIVANFGSPMTDVFLDWSELSHVYKDPKSKKVHGTFGVGWKYQGRTVLRLLNKPFSITALYVLILIDENAQLRFKTFVIGDAR